MDRSAKTGRDLVATTRAIGFAYQSPISGVGMLRRAGILLTKDTQKQIKALEEAGKIEQARALLLDKVASSAKGAAKALGQTSTGQVARLKEQFNQMAESVFKAVIPALLELGPPLIEFVKAAAPAFAAIGKGIAAVLSPVARFVSGLLQSRAAVIALAAAFSAFIAIGIASKVAAMATAMRGLATASAAAGAATAAMGATGAAAGGAAGKVGLLARALPLVMNPLGLLTVGVGLGVAALFAFRNEMSAGDRIMQGMSTRLSEYRAQISQANVAITSQRGLTNAVISTTAQADLATRKHTQAVQAYVNALGAGRAANETEAQYQMRLHRLYVAVAQANVGRVAATNRSTEAVRRAVDGASQLQAAGNKELVTARQRLAAAQQMQRADIRAAMTSEQRAKADAELASASAAVTLAEARRGDRLKSVLSQQIATREAVKKSSMTDAEKAASLDTVNRAINRTRGDLKKLADQPDPKKKMKFDASAAQTTIGIIKTGLANLDGKVVTVTLKALKQGFAFGGMVGFASGGQVRGPGGTDRVPAMLTAGEVVLTKRQQALVDSGMSIRDALISTGGAYKKGGAVGYAAGMKKQGPKETKKDFDARRSAYIASKKQEAKAKRQKAVGRFVQNVGAIEGRRISEKYQGGMTGIGEVEKLRRQQESALSTTESNFTGTISAIAEGIGSFSGSFKDFDKFQTQSNRKWEREWKGTITRIDGSTFTGGLADFEKKIDDSRKAIEAQYSALTVSEQALKSLNDEAAAADLSANVADAQKAYELAKQFGNAKEIADAQKALGKAELDQRRADLEGKAKTEREGADAAKAGALAALEASAATERQMLQDQFDDQKALRDIAFSEARAQLQGQLDAQLQQQRDKDAQALAQLAFQQEQEQAQLDRRLDRFTDHFENARVLTSRAMNGQIKALNDNSASMEQSGTTLAVSFAAGLVKGKPRVVAALKAIGKSVSDYLKLNSPAKKGPLSTLDHWFDALAPTLASGIDTGAIESSINGMRSMSGGGSSGVSINLTVNDSTFAGMSREQADRVARDIQAAIARQVSFTI
jgi:hypothetical protein